MNLVSEVAKMLGVEMEEEFTLMGNDNGTYKFVEKGLVVHYKNTKGWLEATGTFYGLVNGKKTIEKKEVSNELNT